MNRLAQQASPYLRQHADNPVDWFPWGEDAFAEARKRDVPIFLSVGYSACHWCHVMAHESFEDSTTASVMNQYFVNIKVDREEHPVVDSLYMDAVQAISGSGGWPMSVFLTPDGSPFYGGTYFPKDSHHGRPGFTEVLESVHNAWINKRGDLDAQAQEIRTALSHHSQLRDLESGELNSEQILNDACDVLLSHHDPEWGGIGSAPKFPQTHAISMLLWFGARGNKAAKQAAITSLDAMASGGIYDHLGGGFARYSTDAFWMVPHFEKMLYDQAQIARIYLEGFQLTGNENYRQVSIETIEYVLRDLTSPEGLFYSAEDADSEGEEGAFYIWRQEEIEEVCRADAQAVIEWYGITKSGNFEGRNILHRPDRGQLVRTETVERARKALLAKRSTRVRPGLDNKIISEWNGLFISLLADAGRALNNQNYIDTAAKALETLTAKEISRIYGNDISATAGDYAALVDAATRVYEATGKLRWLELAQELSAALIRDFYDQDKGGIFSSIENEPLLFTRSKDVFDGATASATSLSTLALMRLGSLGGESQLINAAETSLSFLSQPLETRPLSFTALLQSVGLSHYGVTQVVIPGPADKFAEAMNQYSPRVVFAHGEAANNSLWADRHEGDVYVCHDFACDLSVSDAEALENQLNNSRY